MASIKTDNGPEGMRNNFEATAAHLLPYDPVAKKRSSGQKRGSAQISSVMDPSPTTTKKPSIGKTGVHLRYYKTGEYKNLTNEQKEELKEWRANNFQGRIQESQERSAQEIHIIHEKASCMLS